MTLVHRVLYPQPIISLADFVKRRGGQGITAAMGMETSAIIEMITQSGPRGRGGAGFPTGVKWRTVADNRLADVASTVIVNAAEGEPGTFKDRTILRRNPYVVVEGALVAARAVGADLVVFAMKQSFAGEVDRTRAAIEEVEDAGWSEGVKLVVFEGPDEYLYGEESALLETIDGRWPFPRIVPTFRRGIETEATADAPSAPALVNNTETMANVARIIARGPVWFRNLGTEASPGTMVCTVTGYTRTHGVGEVQMGTPLREVIEDIGGGSRPGRTIKAVLSGVANAVITADMLDAPVSYEGMAAIGSGLGSAAFIVLDDTVDMASVAAGVARFLAVESCGQCSPCKLDGIALSNALVELSSSNGGEHGYGVVRKRLDTIADRSRCYLATQQQLVIGSIIRHFGAELSAHASRAAEPVAPELIAELLDIRGGKAYLDERHRQKQWDWSYNPATRARCPLSSIRPFRLPGGTERPMTANPRGRWTAPSSASNGGHVRRKVCVVVASRANLARITTVLEAVRDHPALELQVVATASTLLERFGTAVDVLVDAGFTPDARIRCIVEGQTPATMAVSTGLGLIELATAFEMLGPDLVVTVADRFETMATAIAGAYMNIPVAHTQGGEVSGSRSTRASAMPSPSSPTSTSPPPS